MAGVVQLAEHFKKGEVVVVVFHDHGSRYSADAQRRVDAREGLLRGDRHDGARFRRDGRVAELFAVEASRPVEDAVRLMGEHDFSQISVTKSGRIIGSLNESHLYDRFIREPDCKLKPVEAIMQPAFPFVDISTPVELIATMITPENPAVLVRDFKTEKTFIITRSDIIRVMM